MNLPPLIASIAILLFSGVAHAQSLERVKQIGPPTSGSFPYRFTVVGDKLFFLASEDGIKNSLYVTTGTAASTQKISAPNMASSSFTGFTAFANQLFFAADDGINGTELWASDGTAAGTRMVKDIIPGVNGSNPGAFTVMNNKLYFLAKSMTGNNRIYVSDGSPLGTTLVWDNTSATPDFAGGFPILNNELYFKTGSGPGSSLWKSDGTSQGTSLVKTNLNPSCPGGKYAVMGGQLYFNGNGEPWVTNGTDAGTYQIKKIYPNQGNILHASGPSGFTVFNSKVYFAATDETHGEELFSTDGTEAGTVLVKDLSPGTASSAPRQLMVFKNELYIACTLSKQLWKSGGIENNTSLVNTTNESWTFAAIFNNQLYAAPGALSGYLYKTDGTQAGTGIVYYTAPGYTANPVFCYAFDKALPVLNGNLYFGGKCTGVSDYWEPLKFISTVATRSFTFTGSGNWSNPANWQAGMAPPTTLQAGDTVYINQNCTLDIAVQAQPGSSLIVAAGKNLLVQGSLTIQ